jgi:hypothetical protein
MTCGETLVSPGQLWAGYSLRVMIACDHHAVTAQLALWHRHDIAASDREVHLLCGDPGPFWNDACVRLL